MMNKTDKSFSVADEKLLEYAFKESVEKGESSSYLAKSFKMEDGREYQISWQIKQCDANRDFSEGNGKGVA